MADALDPLVGQSAGSARNAAAARAALARAEESPWTSWAHQLGGVLGLHRDALRVAAAVGALVGPGGVDPLACWSTALSLIDGTAGGADAARWLLTNAARASSCWPVNPKIGSVEDLSLEEPDLHASHREAALAFSLPALVAGLSPEPWARFGAAVGPMIDLLHGLDLLLLEEAATDVLRPCLTPIIVLALRRAVEVPGLLLAVAGTGGQQHRLTELQAWFARDAVIDALCDHWTSDLRPRAERAQPPDHGRVAKEVMDTLEAGFTSHVARLRFLRFGFAHFQREPFWTLAAAVEARDAALAYLRSAADWPGSWEVRLGLAHERGKLVGSWFIRGFILRALDSASEPVSREMRDLLDEGDLEGLRWYGGWRGIPPDADSLGLALDLASRTAGFPRARVDRWLEPLWASLPESRVTPTWFHRGPGGPMQDGDLTYQGNDCTAVRLALLLGMLRYDPERFADLIEVNLDQVLESHGPAGFAGVFFYDSAYTDVLFLQLAAVARDVVSAPAIRERVHALRDVVNARIRASQRLDGGWGTPQQTAFRLAGLALSGGHSDDTLRAIRYLGETQRPDGSWAPEPFYLMPGKRAGAVWHQGPELTTAICAVAIAEALSAGGLR